MTQTKLLLLIPRSICYSKRPESGEMTRRPSLSYHRSSTSGFDVHKTTLASH